MVIKRIKGDNYPLEVQILDSDEVAIDLTNATVFFTVKRNLEDTDAQALISVDVTSFASPTTGDVSIPLSSTQTAIVGSFYYDIKIKSVTNVITSVFTDKIIFENHATIRTS